LKKILIILLALFNDNSADPYSNIGNNIKKLSDKEKVKIFLKLKEELLPE